MIVRHAMSCRARVKEAQKPSAEDPPPRILLLSPSSTGMNCCWVGCVIFSLCISAWCEKKYTARCWLWLCRQIDRSAASPSLSLSLPLSSSLSLPLCAHLHLSWVSRREGVRETKITYPGETIIQMLVNQHCQDTHREVQFKSTVGGTNLIKFTSIFLNVRLSGDVVEKKIEQEKRQLKTSWK